MMDYSEFYRTLDRLYKEQDREKIRIFLEDQLSLLDKGDREAGQSAAGADMQLAAAVYNEAASYFRGRGNWEKCLVLYENLLSALNALGITDGENYAVALMNRATAYRFMGELKKAEADFCRAKEMFSESPDPNPYALASLYNNHAAVAAELKDTDKALTMYKNALASLERLQGADEERAITLAAMTLLYLEKGEEKKACECADRAAEMIGNPEAHPHGGAVISAKAHCYYRAGDREKAAELFLQGAEITKRFFGENFEYQNCMENYRKAANS